ncbi:MAG: hypothetical protein EXS03_02560 [Phycisphaerales bacterium]|nr:hypothetical protein [Phycisphaerales bacterium]
MASLTLDDFGDRFFGRNLWKSLAVVLAIVLVTVGLYWWGWMRWKPPPSIFDTPVDDVLGYLALDDFNKLPLDERMKFLMDLATRFRDMDSSDSAAMAGFFAGLAGPMRQQLTQNVRNLARDILVQGAAGYFGAADRGKYIDGWVLEWTKMGERLATGKERVRSDKERLDRIKTQAKRNDQQLGEATTPSLTEDNALDFVSFWQKEVEGTASPKQQGQILRFLEDVRKRYSDAF